MKTNETGENGISMQLAKIMKSNPEFADVYKSLCKLEREGTSEEKVFSGMRGKIYVGKISKHFNPRARESIGEVLAVAEESADVRIDLENLQAVLCYAGPSLYSVMKQVNDFGYDPNNRPSGGNSAAAA